MTKRRRWLVALAVLAAGVGLAVQVVRARLPDHLVPFTDLGVLPLVSSVAEAGEVPETAAGRALVAQLVEIELSTRSSRYAHQTDVDTSIGRYHWDCSGMMGWLLRRHAPRAFAAAGRPRPVARDFARVIRNASTEAPSTGWQRIEHIEDVRSGDVFAWQSAPEMAGPNNTGHVGVVLSTPRRVIAWGSVWSVRIADSTTLPHERDSRAMRADTDGSLGTGVMTFAVDDEGAVTHYGWVGVLSPVYIEGHVVFGRPHG